MSQKISTRTQRRMERKHAMVLFAVVLVVALASFSLGVMVGRSGSRPVATQVASQPVSLPRAAETPVVNASASEVSPVEKGEKLPDEKLTFYDTLPRGDRALGSGINLPPEKVRPDADSPADKAVKTDPVVKFLPPTPKVAPVAKTAPQASVKSAPAVAVASPATGGFIVQVASFQKSDQASALSSKLASKGYVAFVKSADLGSKGVWHRVYAGPYSERPLAEKAAKRLRSEEKFSPLIRKR